MVGMGVLWLCASGGSVHAQTVLQRTPNLNGGWEGSHGTIFFNFLHRFNNTGAPGNKVINSPTLLLGAGLPGNLLIAANYATNSPLVPSYPNEWEFLVRSLPLKQFSGFPVDVALQADYNLAAESVDGELQLSRDLGPFRFMAASRVMSNGYGEDETRFAFGGGALLKLRNWLAVGGDVVRLAEASVHERTAWSGAIQIGIPYTPHSLSLHIANTATSTLQGSSRGSPNHRWGFEFTIPIHPARYFGNQPTATTQESPAVEPADTMMIAERAIARTDTTARVDTTRVVRDTTPPVRPTQTDTTRRPAQTDTTRRPTQTDTTRRTPPTTPPRPTSTPPRQQATTPQPRTVTSRMRNLVFEPGRIQVPPGSTVVWRNDDQVAHTVKAANGSWESPMIQPGATYRRTFPRAGTFQITCGPHPFMKQVVEVK
jgi:plastocyanin